MLFVSHPNSVRSVAPAPGSSRGRGYWLLERVGIALLDAGGADMPRWQIGQYVGQIGQK